MTPQVRIHCRDCHRDAHTRDLTVVTLITADCSGLSWIDAWRATCPLCGAINITNCTLRTADLLAEAGFRHVHIEPPRERQPDLGPWTVDDLAEYGRLYGANNGRPPATTGDIWAELDDDLHGTDSGWIDWGDGR